MSYGTKSLIEQAVQHFKEGKRRVGAAAFILSEKNFGSDESRLRQALLRVDAADVWLKDGLRLIEESRQQGDRIALSPVRLKAIRRFLVDKYDHGRGPESRFGKAFRCCGTCGRLATHEFHFEYFCVECSAAWKRLGTVIQQKRGSGRYPPRFFTKCRRYLGLPDDLTEAEFTKRLRRPHGYRLPISFCRQLRLAKGAPLTALEGRIHPEAFLKCTQPREAVELFALLEST